MKQPISDIISLSLELSRYLNRTMVKQQHGQGINPMGAFALSCIECHKDITVSAFAKEMSTSASTASAFIERLVKQDFVTRTHDPLNRRRVLLQLTPLGKRTLQSSRRKKEALLTKMYSVLSPEDREHLRRIYTELLRLKHS